MPDEKTPGQIAYESQCLSGTGCDDVADLPPPFVPWNELGDTDRQTWDALATKVQA